jgi:hypothetical protein
MVAAIAFVALAACNPITLTPRDGDYSHFSAHYTGPYNPSRPWVEIQVPDLSPEDDMIATVLASGQGGLDSIEIPSTGYHATDVTPHISETIYVVLECEDESNNRIPCRTRSSLRMRVMDSYGPFGDLTEVVASS